MFLFFAIVQGMVDNGEHVSATLKREFGEEALNSIEEGVRDETKQLIAEFFKKGDKVTFIPFYVQKRKFHRLYSEIVYTKSIVHNGNKASCGFLHYIFRHTYAYDILSTN